MQSWKRLRAGWQLAYLGTYFRAPVYSTRTLLRPAFYSSEAGPRWWKESSGTTRKSMGRTRKEGMEDKSVSFHHHPGAPQKPEGRSSSFIGRVKVKPVSLFTQGCCASCSSWFPDGITSCTDTGPVTC